jgi:hypothetical protein
VIPREPPRHEPDHDDQRRYADVQRPRDGVLRLVDVVQPAHHGDRVMRPVARDERCRLDQERSIDLDRAERFTGAEQLHRFLLGIRRLGQLLPRAQAFRDLASARDRGVVQGVRQ